MKGRETADSAERGVLYASSGVRERRFYCGKTRYEDAGESWGIMILMLEHYLHISLSGLVPMEPDLQLRYQQSLVRQ